MTRNVSFSDRHASASESEKKDHEKKFKEIGEAYAVLSDSRKRIRYDNGQDMDDMDGGHGHAGFGHGIDPNHIFQTFFANGAGGMSGGMGGPGQGFSFGGGPGGNNFSFQFG
jgi:DnaJ family protein C protein 7